MSNDICNKHSGFESDIKTLYKFKEDMVSPGGVIERLENAINSKLGRGLLIAFIVMFVGILSTLYGLTYSTQSKILSEMSIIQSDIAVIKSKVK
jgi:hypothetical protein